METQEIKCCIRGYHIYVTTLASATAEGDSLANTGPPESDKTRGATWKEG